MRIAGRKLQNQLFFSMGLLACLLMYRCRQERVANTFTTPKHFKVQLPYRTDNVGIIVGTFWGQDKIFHQLYLDNNSPTWTNNNVIEGNRSIEKSTSYAYKTNVADGNDIQGDVYVCNSLAFGTLMFNDFYFYNITATNNARAIEQVNGVIGENLLSFGICKFDFRYNRLTFASSLDSLDDMDKAQLLPSEFKNNTIEISVAFRTNKTKVFQLDLGFNGMLILPEDEFKHIDVSNSKKYSDSGRFSTPNSSNKTTSVHAFDSIIINQKYYATMISTNKLVKESLIGRLFFERFDFLILDYLNKAVYVSNTKLY